jgi:hypothetical protein
LTRVLGYELNVPFRGVSEYHLEALEIAPAKLIIVPSAHNMDDKAFAKLLDQVSRTGATLLYTGPIGIDAYWRRTDRLTDALGERKLSNVAREERLLIGDKQYPVSYGNRRIAEVFKEFAVERQRSVTSAAADTVVDVAYGQGRLIWCPLPVELNERIEPIAGLYAHALKASGYQPSFDWLKGGDLPGVYGRQIKYRDGALYVFVSEYAYDTQIEVKDAATGIIYSFVLERERAVLFAADSNGQLSSVYRPDEVEVKVVTKLFIT